MGSVAVGAMVVGTSLLVVFALAMATLESQVDDSIAQIEATAEPVAQFTIEDTTNVEGAVVGFTINNGGTKLFRRSGRSKRQPRLLPRGPCDLWRYSYRTKYP